MAATMITLTGKYHTLEGDAASGSVSFTLSAPLLDSSGDVIYPTLRRVVTLDGDGAFSVELPATKGDDGTAPSGLTYVVKETLSPNVQHAYAIELDTANGETQDLSDIAPSTDTVVQTYALVSALTSHTALTEDVHGITNTANLATLDDLADISPEWGNVSGTLADQTDLATALNAKEDALGFTPVNQAGDTMTGDLDLGNNELTLASIRQEDGNNVNRFNLKSSGHIDGGAANFVQFDDQIRIPSAMVNSFLSIQAPTGNDASLSLSSNNGISIALKTTTDDNTIDFEGNGKGLARIVENDKGGQLTIGATANATARLDIINSVATIIGTIIQAAASQSADLQQWQDSSGAPLSRVDAVGRFVLATVEGTPTGTPTTGTTVLDTSANKLWIYCGTDGWKSTALT